jgi:hypothetical protein
LRIDDFEGNQLRIDEALKKRQLALQSANAASLVTSCQTGSKPPSRVGVEAFARCDGGGLEEDTLEVFTADEPAAGSAKYEETAVAMIALLKSGTGMPFKGLERLQGQLGMPLPATTQWELMEAAAKLLRPVLEELIRQAAQGSVMHNDDTKPTPRCSSSRTRAGLAHARQNGRRLGRPATAVLHAAEIRKLHRGGASKSEIARRLQIGRTPVRRILG